VLLDLDNFKQINDMAGRETGDVLLTAIAIRLGQGVLPSCGTRLDGDEFSLILPEVQSPEVLSDLLKRMLSRLRAPCVHEGRNPDLRGSMGAAIFPLHGASRSALLRNADIALDDFGTVSLR